MTEQELMIGSKSSQMQWILLKFLKDSLDFLSQDCALGTNRIDWVKTWQDNLLTQEQMDLWMPKEPPTKTNHKFKNKEKNNENAIQNKSTV